jgi:hypothetical protein
MNQKVPKPIVDALAREAAPGAHPAADVLTAFVERTLTGGEQQRVTDHLARCSECREIVFLAGNASEEPVAQEQELVAAVRVSPAAAISALPLRWAPRLLWAVPVAAALLVGGFLVWQPSTAVRPETQLASKAMSPAPEPPMVETQRAIASPPAPEPSPMKPGQENPARAASARNVPLNSADTLAMESSPSKAGSQPPQRERTAAREANPGQATIAIGAPTTAGASAVSNVTSFASSESEREKLANTPTGQLLLTPRVTKSALGVVHPQWRVTAEGRLEHFTHGAWAPVLANQSTTFRVVAEVANNVWAGGDDGVLFRSSDGGQHWSRVALATPNAAETSAIISIRFDDQQHGTVMAESGSQWVTSDGGTTWTRQ